MLSKLGSDSAPAVANLFLGMGATLQPHTQELIVLMQSRENEANSPRRNV